MVDERDIFVIRQSESGDYYLVPLSKAEVFWEDELEGNADYAEYIELDNLQIYDYEA